MTTYRPSEGPPVDAGGPVDYLDISAVISEDGLYRYSLTRVWHTGRPEVIFVMLNPSTADGSTDDATIRACVGFARVWGMGTLTVLNLYALRSRDPGALRGGPDPVGPANDEYLQAAARRVEAVGGLLVAGWGAHAAPARVDDVQCFMSGFWCLMRNQDGSPRHPLYVSRATSLKRWP